MPWEHHLELLDGTGRQFAHGKRGAILAHLAPRSLAHNSH
jgi:hypothetical protein